MSMKGGENKYLKIEVILLPAILFSILLVFCLICCLIIWKADENKRTFVDYISINMEEAELYFREKEGWEIEISKEENKLFLIVTTEEGVQYIFRKTYIFRERYIGDNIDRIEQKVIREENGKTIRGELHILRGTWNFRDIIEVIIDREGPEMVVVKYGIPEFELIDDWGDPGEAELGILKWVNMDKIRGDWEYAEEMMQKLEEFVRLSTDA